MKKVLLIDNYDSFTYNLYHLIEKNNNVKVTVLKNDEKTLEKNINRFNYIILSPGPGIPSEAGLLPKLMPIITQKENVLGVCLGHQLLAEYYGGKIVNLNSPLHGVATKNFITSDVPIFNGLPRSFNVARYHSWTVELSSIETNVTSIDERNNILSFKIINRNTYGLQFHPESILSQYGFKLIFNWLNQL